MTELGFKGPSTEQLRRRYLAEKRFRLFALFSVLLGLAFLGVLFIIVAISGADAVRQTKMLLTISLDAGEFEDGKNSNSAQINKTDFEGFIKKSMRSTFPDATTRKKKRELSKLVSPGAAYEIREFILTNPNQIGEEITIWVTASDDVDMLMKGILNRDLPADLRQLSDQQLMWLDQLRKQNKLEMQFNWTLFT